MIELRVLGGSGLTRTDGVEVGSVLTQPKRFALLVYLALAAPGDFVRRDTLLALFWPGSNDERARGSLRSSLHFLRRSLGADVVVSRGTEELGLSPDAVVCDAVTLREAVRAGRPEEALALYAGPLLPGFSADGSSEWEEWLELERARLARAAADAAWALAERAEAGADVVSAVAYARRATELAVADEEPARRLMLLLGRVGDGAAALQVYDELATRMDRDYGASPSAATRELAARLRRPHQPTPTSTPTVTPSPRVTETPARSFFFANPDPPGARVTPQAHPGRSGLRPRPRLLTGGLILLALALVALGPLAVRQAVGSLVKPEPPPLTSGRVVVLPFAVRGYTAHEYLGEGMVDLLSAALDGAGELQAVDPRAVLSVSAGTERETDAAEAESIARRFGARLYVLGGLVISADDVQASASLYDLEDPAEPLAVARAQGPTGDVFGLVDALAEELLAGRLSNPEERLDRTAARTTHSLSALKRYLQGTNALRAGRFEEAAGLYEEALEHDSTFALAAYRLSLAQDMSGHSNAIDPVSLALRHADRLSERDRLLIEARAARSEPERTERIYRRLLAVYPDDVDAWYQLGDILFHMASQRGGSVTEAAPVFRRVLSYEPAHLATLQHLARIAAVEADRPELEGLTRRALEVAPDGDIALEMMALRALVLDDSVATTRLLELLSTAADNRVWATAWRAALYSAEFGQARALIEPLTSPVRPREVRAYGYIALAHLEIASGRPTAAGQRLRQAEAELPGVALQFEVMWAAFPFRSGGCEEDTAGLGARVRAGSFGRTIPATLPSVQRNHLDAGPDVWREYLSGLLAACAGLAIDAQVAALDRAEPWSSALSDVVRARAAWAGGANGAVDAPAGASLVPVQAPLMGGVHNAFLRAELLLRSGRLDEGLAWYGAALNDLDYTGAAYLAPSWLRRAETLERLGRPDDAAAAYRRFAEIWRDAEPRVRPLVRRAEARAATLVGSPRGRPSSPSPSK